MFALVVTVDLPCYASIPSNSIESTQPICNVVLGSVVRMVTESELLRTQTCNHKSHKGFLCNKRQTQNLLCTQVDVLEGEILVTSVLWGWTASLSPAGWRNCNLGTCVLQSQPPCSTNVASYVTLVGLTPLLWYNDDFPFWSFVVLMSFTMPSKQGKQ